MALQWVITAIMVALCLIYVVKGLLPKAGAATCGGGCKGCTAHTAGNAVQPLVFYPPKKPKI